MKKALLLTTIFHCSGLLFGQHYSLPDASPRASVSEQMGITDVQITYSRPSVKGREIWGGLVPFDQVWRAGADENTTVSFSHDVKVNGQPLPAGTYGFHVIPKEEVAVLIFSHDINGWGSFAYNEENDALRVETDFSKSLSFTEALTYSLSTQIESEMKVKLNWADRQMSFTVTTNTKQNVYDHLKVVLKGIAQFDYKAYIEAANYLLINDYELDQALAWTNYSINGFFGAREEYQNLMLKSQILNRLDKNEEALQFEKQALNHPSATVNDLYSFARNLIRTGELKKALEYSRLTQKKHPLHWLSPHGLARVYSAMGDYKKALQYEQEAQKIAPEQSQAVIAKYIGMLQNGEDFN